MEKPSESIGGVLFLVVVILGLLEAISAALLLEMGACLTKRAVGAAGGAFLENLEGKAEVSSTYSTWKPREGLEGVLILLGTKGAANGFKEPATCA